MSSDVYKAQAARLAEHLSSVYGLNLKHTKSLEAIAAVHGARTWNVLSSLAAAPATAPAAAQGVPSLSTKGSRVLECTSVTRNELLQELLTTELARTGRLVSLTAATSTVTAAMAAAGRAQYVEFEAGADGLSNATLAGYLEREEPVVLGAFCPQDRVPYYTTLSHIATTLESVLPGLDPQDWPILVTDARCNHRGSTRLVTVVVVPDASAPNGVCTTTFVLPRTYLPDTISLEELSSMQGVPESFGLPRQHAYERVKPAYISMGTSRQVHNLHQSLQPALGPDVQSFELNVALTPAENGLSVSAVNPEHLHQLLCSLIPESVNGDAVMELQQMLRFLCRGLPLGEDVLRSSYEHLTTADALASLIGRIVGDTPYSQIPELRMVHRLKGPGVDCRKLLEMLHPLLVRLTDLVTSDSRKDVRPIDSMWADLFYATGASSHLTILQPNEASLRAWSMLSLVAADLAWRRAEARVCRPLALVKPSHFYRSLPEMWGQLEGLGVPTFLVPTKSY